MTTDYHAAIGTKQQITTSEQCCHCQFLYHWIWGFSVLSGVLGFFIENLGFFDSGQIFVNVCRNTVFSIQEYSSFTGVTYAESVASTVE